MEKKSKSDNSTPELDTTASATSEPASPSKPTDSDKANSIPSDAKATGSAKADTKIDTQAEPPAKAPSSTPPSAPGTQPATGKARHSKTADKAASKTAAKASTQSTTQSTTAASAKTTSQPKPDTPASKPASPTVASAASKNGISKLAIAALILAVAGLAVIGYGHSLIQTLQIQQAEQVNALKTQLDDSNGINRQLQQQNGQILGELNQIRTTASTQQSHVDELQNRLAKSMQQVSKLGTDTRKDWLLAEVEYLLRLANQRVLMERTASGALSLLKGADKILKETEDVSIYPVRKALARDVLALESVPAVDVEGMYLKLVAIDSQVDQLRLLPTTDKHQLPEMLQQITVENMSQSWQDSISQSWANTVDKLGNLIVIRHRDDPVAPLLSPEQHYFLTQNLHLMLEQTQLALLQGKQQAFDTGLTKTTVWIKTYFEASDPTTQALAGNLEAMQGTQIAPQLPDISGSLKRLKTYLSELHNLEGAAL